ncbi:(2Fe-2S) ferredoxin domain-containing protein [Crocosphaera sp. UHCC 0190]|uniref:(2Fe-2S) ferredoxin domain-containing protein n=1 Tax=Crocosphaera sp. UHCC 0190 TaxID=3110246 RepID=UPI002B1F9E6D|nr:(2Fe-2S) ferredoxin domain-containing protein [Crocosphaera sp. UHCC 0190]MEA5508949.1 (2Fe-2S) ferredoxin domain-containing protein [Crocosphaera sp. UHCC 0190]
MSNLTAVSQFRLVGQLESFVIKEGDKLKYLRIKVNEREYWLKIPKQLRSEIDPNLSPGTWLEVTGTRETKKKMGFFELKVSTVNLLPTPDISYAVIVSETPNQASGKILVCQKSSCWKRGGEKLCQQLEKQLGEQGLSDRVEIQLTGCLKQCKQGPNLVMLPDKTRYSQVKPYQVTELLDKHFKP